MGLFIVSLCILSSKVAHSCFPSLNENINIAIIEKMIGMAVYDSSNQLVSDCFRDNDPIQIEEGY